MNKLGRYKRMKKTNGFCLLIPLLCFIGCATTQSVNSPTSGADVYAGNANSLVQYREIELSTENEGVQTGKIMRLEGDHIIFLPYPYWNLQAETVPIDNILKITVIQRDWYTIACMLNGAAWGFIIPGIYWGSISEYKEDIEVDARDAGRVAFFCGLAGFALGGLIDIIDFSLSNHDFKEMSLNEKQNVIKKIMG
jgi:hypothetical protein